MTTPLADDYTKSAILDAVADTHEHYCEGAASAVVQVLSHAAVVGANLVFEGRISDEAPWVLLHCMPTDDTTPNTPLTSTGAFTGVPARGWRLDLQGISTYRARVSALTSGTFVIGSKLSRVEYS